jgi:hypothetical protein
MKTNQNISILTLAFLLSCSSVIKINKQYDYLMPTILELGNIANALSINISKDWPDLKIAKIDKIKRIESGEIYYFVLFDTIKTYKKMPIKIGFNSKFKIWTIFGKSEQYISQGETINDSVIRNKIFIKAKSFVDSLGININGPTFCKKTINGYFLEYWPQVKEIRDPSIEPTPLISPFYLEMDLQFRIYAFH